MPAYAYLRKSSVRDPSREESYEIQESAVRALARRHGDEAGLVLLSDWDLSGKLGRDRRPGYNALLEAIETGRCTGLYSYSLSRLGRSVAELARLIGDCSKRGIPVRIDRDVVDTSTASGMLLFNVLSSVAQFESDVASERVRGAIEAKRARGETVGTAKGYGEALGEDASAVLAAFHESGSYSGAAKLLNGQGLAPRNGRAWWPSSVAVIVKRLDPSVAARRPSRGYAAGGTDFLLARLLRCPTCGTRLSGTRDRVDGKNHGRVRYACRLGTVMPHARVSVSEHLILPKIQDEASLLATPDQVAAADDDSERRAELDQRRDRILDMYEAGHIDREGREKRLGALTDEIERLDVKRVIVDIPSIDWGWPTKQLNGVLRALFDDVTLDEETFQPVKFRWSVPEWRLTTSERPSAPQ